MTTDQLTILRATANNDNAGESRFQIASLLAYQCLFLYQQWKEGRSKAEHELAYQRLLTAEHACELLCVPYDVILSIRRGQLKGLRNLSRIGNDKAIFENDYDFKHSDGV